MLLTQIQALATATFVSNGQGGPKNVSKPRELYGLEGVPVDNLVSICRIMTM
jgi:hypothetical protein